MRIRKGTIAVMVVLLLLGLIVAVQSALACRCTPGFWKNHTDLWHCSDFAPGQTLADAGFALGSYTDLNGDSHEDTLLNALQYGGGPGVGGAMRNLLRLGVAALLNEQCHYKWFADRYDWAVHVYPIQAIYGWPFDGEATVEELVNEALSENRRTMLTLHRALDNWNNYACKKPCDSWPECDLEPIE